MFQTPFAVRERSAITCSAQLRGDTLLRVRASPRAYSLHTSLNHAVPRAAAVPLPATVPFLPSER